MHRTYRIAGRLLGSAVQLPELHPAEGPADLTFEFGHCPNAVGRTVRRFSWSDATFLTVDRGDAGWLFRFPGTAVFLVTSAGQIVCETDPGAAPHTVRHLLVDQVIPLYLAGAHAETVLHASAVAIPTERGTRAVLFVGGSGAGKSTTATALARLGAPLLADDFALVGLEGGRCFVPPAGVGVRLWPGTFGIVDAHVPRLPVADWHDKERFLLSPAQGLDPVEAVELVAIVRLDARGDTGSSVCLRPVGLTRATALLLDQSYRPDTATPEANAHTLRRLVELVETVPVVSTSMPHSLETIAASCAQLVAALGALAGERTATP